MEAHTKKPRTFSNSTNLYLTLILVLYNAFNCNCLLAPNTSYDGVTYNYNSYIQLQGSTGIQIPEKVDSLTSYSMSIWFKMNATPWTTNSDMALIQFGPSAFACALSQQKILYCNSDQGTSLSASITAVTGSWYMLLLKSTQNSCQMQVKELRNSIAGQVSTNMFFPYGFTNLTFQNIYIGIKSDKSLGFQGFMRNLKLFSTALTDTQFYSVQFTYIYPYQDLRVQVQMRDTWDINNDCGSGIGQAIGKTIAINKYVDFMGSHQCFNPQYSFPSFLNFSNTNFKLNEYYLSSNFDSSKDYAGSLEMWVMRKPSVVPSQDELLFTHSNVMNLAFYQKNNDYLSFYGHLQTAYTLTYKMRRGIWYYIQAQTDSGNYHLYIADAQGNQLYDSGMLWFNDNQYTSSENVFIGQNFYGFIRGIKYYKSNLNYQSAQAMSASLDSSSDLMFYFLFTTEGYDSTKKVFNNFAQKNSLQTLGVQSGTASFNTSFWFEMTASPTVGVVSQTTLFDGYTCADGNTKFQVTSSSQSASSLLQVTKQTTSYTLEFWVRPLKSQAGTAHFITLSATQNPGTFYFTIRQESTSLYCYPSLSYSTNDKLVYPDYSYNPGAWEHVACVYDGTNSEIQGFYYLLGQSYDYSVNINKNLNYQIKPGYFTLWVNGVSTKSANGLNIGLFSEIRFWNSVRSTFDIRCFRFHQLDINATQSLLYSYMKLFNGGFQSANETDYADPQLSKLVTFSGTSWSPNTEMIVCPLGMYKYDTDDHTCYRDGVSSINITVLKGTNNYTVSARQTVFKNIYLMTYATSIYNMTWSGMVLTKNNNSDIVNFQNALAPQSTNMIILFNYNQISSSPVGIYNLTFSIQDKNLYQLAYNKTFQLKTVNCLSLLINNQPEDSTSYVQFATSKNNENAVFSYNYTNCEGYQFDTRLMSISYTSVANLSFAQNNLNSLDQTITIPSYDQFWFNVDQYYYLQIIYGWRSASSASDTIQYTKNVGFKFVPELVVKLTQNYRTVIKGETLVLNASQTSFINNDNTYNFTLSWTCPGPYLSIFCATKTGPILEIPYSDFEKSALDSWTGYLFTVNATLNIPSPAGDQSKSANVTVIWVPFNTQAQITGNQNPVTQLVNVYQLNIYTNFSESSMKIQWTISPSINSTYLLNSNNRKQLVIDKNGMKQGVTYNISAMLVYSPKSWVLWSGDIIVSPSKCPYGGTFSVSPTTGTAFQTQFKFTVSGWKTANSPLKYQYYYTDSNGTMYPLSGLMLDTTFQTYLPPTTNITVQVFDYYQTYNYTSITISVKLQANNTASVLNLLNQASSNSQVQTSTMIQQIGILSNAVPAFTSLFNSSYQQALYGVMASLVKKQTQNFDQFPDQDSQNFFMQNSMQIFNSLTSNPQLFNATSALDMQDSVQMLLDQTDTLSFFLQNDDFHNDVLQTQSNMLYGAEMMYQNGLISDDQKSEQLVGNVTDQLRLILVKYEQFLSTNGYEAMNMLRNYSYLKFQVAKFSRIGNTMPDFQMNINQNAVQFSFPLSEAVQPSDRQSLSIITFNANPFLGSYYLNQSAKSNSSIYFAYRDVNGTYLNNSYLAQKINMTFDYDYPEFSFLANQTVCGYIGINDKYWENKSCSVTWDRDNSQVHCSCFHMSFYSVIDDSLRRPDAIPLIYLAFQNWSSFAVFMYMVLIFILGVIYTYNKDNQDFRFLHEQEENNGEVLRKEDSLTINQLAFKRQVFYMAFCAQFSFSVLFRIFVLKLHPILQLKYNFDPQIPRFYRFLMIFTRIMLILLGSFLILRDEPDVETQIAEGILPQQILTYIGFIIAGSVILVPLPIFLFTCCKAKYTLAKGEKDNEENMVFDDQHDNKQQQNPSKIVYIDPSLPIRLLFLINSYPVQEIFKIHQKKLPYANGNAKQLGIKLKELNEEEDEEDEKESEGQSDEKSEGKSDQESSQRQSEHGTNRDLMSDEEANRRVPNTMRNNQISVKNGQRQKSISKIKEEDKLEEEKDASYVYNEKTNNKIISPSQIKFDDFADYNDNEENLNDDEDNGEGDDDEDEEGDDDEEDGESEEDEEENEGGERSPKQGSQHSTNIRADTNRNNFNSNNIVIDLGQAQPNRNNPEQRQATGEQEEESSATMNTNDFITDRKELERQRNLIGIVAVCTLAFLVNAGMIYCIMHIYITEQYYNKNSQYVWVGVFFLSQVVGFMITDIIALIVMATSVFFCCKKRKTFLAYFLRESLVIYEDYKYVFRFMHTNLN